jgi:hypothetical protein
LLSGRQNDVSLSFCPVETLGRREGGCPKYNQDGRSDTPCFQASHSSVKQEDQRYGENFFKQMPQGDPG